MRRLLLASIFILPVRHAAAQAGATILGGYVSSTEVGEDGAQARGGFAVGIGLTPAHSGAIGFAPELLYVQKGLKFSDSFSTGESRTSYVEAEALFELNAGTGRTHFVALVGPYVAFLAHCSASLHLSSGDDFVSDCTSDDSQNTGPTKTAAGIALGAGIATGRVAVTARYELDVTKTFPGSSVHNRALLVMLSYAVR